MIDEGIFNADVVCVREDDPIPRPILYLVIPKGEMVRLRGDRHDGPLARPTVQDKPFNGDTGMPNRKNRPLIGYRDLPWVGRLQALNGVRSRS